METEKKLCVLVVVILFFSSLVSAGKVEGELKVWHKVTLSFDGPQTSEQATPNPFTGYRLDVTFTGPSGQTYVVPGYYAANGDAANSSADTGNQWRAHLAPDENGKWQWKASFRKGNMVAVDGDPQAGQPAGYMDGTKGSFEIQASDKTGRDFRGKGMLQYVGKHHL
ncbi:MAG: DUF5060 domain-containing protein, partial [Sedimentisphaerales bacterium]|nr:DUF5060 domain-containing protein [Sedimentisphaerales bacterium]